MDIFEMIAKMTIEETKEFCKCYSKIEKKVIKREELMKFEKAIDKLENYLQLYKEDGDPIIELLQRGKAFEDILEKIINEFAYIEQMNQLGNKYTYENIMTVINKAKEKYFPKDKVVE